jgi:hypothetical protein
VSWRRLTIALIVGFSLTTPALRSSDPATAGMRVVAAAGVETHLPPKWEFRPLGASSEERRKGLQASSEALGMIPTDLRQPGLEAYWVDATDVGVPSDYYRFAARGPVQDVLRSPGCHRDARVVARSAEEVIASGQYVSAQLGTCQVWNGSVRWASFVAAPGFGPTRSLGIPRSGLYVVRASVPDGPDAERQLRMLMNGVSFGGTSVPELMSAAGLPAKLP